MKICANATVTAASLLIVLSGLTSAAHAGHVVYGVKASTTSTIMHGGNRELTQLGFNGTTDTMQGDDFLNFSNGSLTSNSGTYGWTDLVPRDVNGSNNHNGNPDRADSASPYLTEAGKTGTLAEVFGSFGSGYKNMSYIIDGEDSKGYTLDLLFGNGFRLDADNDASTIEFSWLERGGNSDMRLFGIKEGGVLTADSIKMGRNQTTSAGWRLDTLEIGGAQDVEGLGISLDSSWSDLVGFRLVAVNGDNGPDVVAVGTSELRVVPTPGPVALMAAGMGLMVRRRR